MKKSIVTAIVCSMMLIMFPMTSMASGTIVNEVKNVEGQVTPRWSYIVDTWTDLGVSGDTATVNCWVKGNVSTATKAKAIVELQVKNSATNWIPVAIWTDTQDDFMAYVYESKEINPDNTYRVKATYTVWEGTRSETTTVYTD